MNSNDNHTDLSGHNRRDVLKLLGMGSAAGLFGMLGSSPAKASPLAKASPPTGPFAASSERPYGNGGLPPLKIKSVKAIGTAPEGANLVVVKVETTEPGLYGIGCATFTQRAEAVVTAINSYMGDFCIGRDVDNIEDMWQAFFVSSYWRKGPGLKKHLGVLVQALG